MSIVFFLFSVYNMGMTKKFQRAKSDENKELRMQQIMEVTDQLFHQDSYHNVSLSHISEAAGFARGGLYKYVSSKEEIFLMIYRKKQEKFITTLSNEFQKSDGSISAFISLFVSTMYQNLDYLKYHQILNAIIETNTSVEKLAEFKRENKIQISGLHTVLQSILPLSFPDFFSFYLVLVYHGVYLYDRIVLRDNFIEAMRLAELPIDPIDFVEEYTDFLQMYVQHTLEKRD